METESRTLQTYYESVREARERTLTLAQADRLALAAKAGDRRAAEELMRRTIGLLPVIVKRATGGARMDSFRREELFQVAAQELLECLSRWNSSRGYWRSFATSSAELKVRTEFSSGVTEVPVHMRPELQRAASDVLRERATFEEASNRGGVSEVTLRAAIETSQAGYVSKDQELGDAGDTYTLDIEDPENNYAGIYEDDISRRIEEILDHLSEIDRRIICKKYGLFGYERRPVIQIGAELGMERGAIYGRVERIERRLKFGLAQRVLIPESNLRDHQAGRAA